MSPRKTPNKRKQTTRLIPSPPPEAVDLDEARKKFLEIWSDPLDPRKEPEISKMLKVTTGQLVRWRNEPSFYKVANERITQAMDVALIPIYKSLYDRAINHGSKGATDTILEMLNKIDGKGTKISIGTGTSFQGEDFTDEELSDEITRLLTETHPEDLSLVEGRVKRTDLLITAGEVSKADAIDVDIDEHDTIPGSRMDSENKEPEALQLAVGAAAEDGS